VIGKQVPYFKTLASEKVAGGQDPLDLKKLYFPIGLSVEKWFSLTSELVK